MPAPLMPAPLMLAPLMPRQESFSGCVGFLDGSEIPLQSKPKYDHETYFLRKKIYGFNLQAISDWSGRFIYAATDYTASTHDSTAIKNCILYREQSTYMSNDEYLLADESYQLDCYVITPYKEPVSRQRSHASFNYVHSTTRVKIEHAFGVLKARWKSLHCYTPHTTHHERSLDTATPSNKQ